MIEAWELGESVTELAKRFAVSRQTIYTYIGRWEEQGPAGLEPRSRVPQSNSRQTAVEVRNALLNLKERHPGYGPHKLVRLLANEQVVLSPSTARDILDQNGLVKARRARKHRWSPATRPSVVIPGPGHTMSADYKGQFRLGNGRYCYPLTIADPGSRFVLAIDALPSTKGQLAGPVFERVFREWGLPEQILTDNGAPFCSTQSIGGISHLSKFWIKLGIRHLRIQPGRPQQNGIHERMHRTFKAEATRPRELNMAAQQRRCDSFRQEFNHVRPHQALGQECPGTKVQPYRRSYPSRLISPEYPATFQTRRVRSAGQIEWQGQTIHIGQVLIGEPVAFLQVHNYRWQLYFGSAHLADWDATTKTFVRAVPTP